MDVSPIVERLVGERLEDGGWNCERPNGSTRSSFHTTINVLEGLLEHERATGGTPDSRAARRSGEEYLLQRQLFRRLGSGEPADEEFLSYVEPSRWQYHVLRALDYFRAAADLGDGCGTRDWGRRSTTSAASRRRRACGCSTAPRPVASGSTWTTGSASPRAG